MVEIERLKEALGKWPAERHTSDCSVNNHAFYKSGWVCSCGAAEINRARADVRNLVDDLNAECKGLREEVQQLTAKVQEL